MIGMVIKKVFKQFLWVVAIANLSYGYASEAIGESDFEIYQGPLDPSLRVIRYNGVSVFKDEEFIDNYLIREIAPELLDLNQFVDEYVLPKFTCHPDIYQKNFDYMRHLFRLIAISNSYEALRQIHLSLYQIGEKESRCELTYEETFAKCTPQSIEMKKFKNRVEDFFPDLIDWGKYPLLFKNKNINSLVKYHGPQIKDLLSSGTKLEEQLVNSCSRIKKSMISICSEDDNLYGMSSIPFAFRYIRSSSAFKILDTEGRGEECLSQFVNFNSNKEKFNDFLSSIYTQKLEDSNKIFFYGSLKEFDDQGVELVKTKKDKEEVLVAVVEKKDPRVVKEPRTVIDKPQIVAHKKKKVAKVKKVIKKQSAIQMAVENFVKTKKESLVDLNYMKSDYKYPRSILKKLNGPLRVYQTQLALKEMRKFDNLGSIQTPLSFLFLRYLLDFDLHQGLFNLINVLGEEFYIIDDIENMKKPIKIKVINNEQTRYRWKVSVIDAS